MPMEVVVDYGCTGRDIDTLLDRIRPIIAVARISPGVWIVIRKPDEVWMITQGEHSIEFKGGKKLPRSKQVFYMNRVANIRSVSYRLDRQLFWK